MAASTKRKHCTLTLKEKCKILDSLDEGSSVRKVAEAFKVPKSTVSDIKKKKDKIRSYVSKSFSVIGKSIFFSYSVERIIHIKM